MAEKNKYRTDPLILAQLDSGSEDRVLKAVALLRNTGNPLYIPFLVQTLQRSESLPVKNSILSLFSELKDRESIPYLIDAIDNDDNSSIRKELVSCCWQNGLDYSEYLAFFVDLVINNQFGIAFEAFTVIENLEQFPGMEIRETEIRKIKNALLTSTGTGNYLLNELLNILA